MKTERTAEKIMQEIDSVLKVIDSLKTKIDYAVAEKKTVPIDKVQMARTKHVLRLAQRKHQELLREYGPVKKERDRRNNEARAIRFETSFLESCRAMLDKDTFGLVWNAAHKSFHQQEADL